LWSTLLLLAFCAAFLLPRQYHMTFVENEKPEHLNIAYWLFPLYLLLLNLPIIPILFAGRFLSLDIAPDFYVLGMSIQMNNAWLAGLIFLGGLSAASAMMIVTTLALSYMCLNYLLLPASLRGSDNTDFYQRLLWSKRLIIALIIAAGYGFYIVIESNQGLASLGLISFVAAAQLLPGVIGLLFWARGTQVGFLAGLGGGAIVWFLLLIWPLLSPDTQIIQAIPIDTDIWTFSTFCTLSANGFLFVIGSLLSQPTLDEQSATQATLDRSSFALSEPYTAGSVQHYLFAMQESLGNKVAEKEFESALLESGIDANETRKTELRLFHERLERNLTGLLGPATARTILRPEHIDSHSGTAESPDSRLLEMRLEASREQMRGMTKQLDDLRRYLRDVLLQMPLGVCSIATNGTVFLWNSTMVSYTGINENIARNRSLSQLPSPWNNLLNDFARSSETHRFRCHISHQDRNFTFNLHKADIGDSADTNDGLAGQVILMEDRTDLDTLETELAHSERLASVGRLAAGVAHEIGNPLTGIASIAQNLHHDSQANLNGINTEEESISEQANDIMNQVDRINSIVRSLLTFSHAEEFNAPSSQAIDLVKSVNESVRLIKLSPEVRNIQFEIFMPNQLTVNGDSNQLVQVFVNLINNACDASNSDGVITIKGELIADQAQISVCDSGTGIDPAIKEQVFEPFFTTKEVGRGTGLGLSLVYSIVTNHGGRVRILDHPNAQGTCIQVTIPAGTD
jgi:signal transduction histidine kinase